MATGESQNRLKPELQTAILGISAFWSSTFRLSEGIVRIAARIGEYLDSDAPVW
jgi:hypothetical protein